MQKILLALTILFAIPSLAYAADVKDSADHPLISRYQGTTIVAYQQKAFDEYKLVLGEVRRVKGYGADMVLEVKQGKDLEGKVTRILYRAPKNRSTLEIYRNYQMQLQKAGFEILYQCKKNACSEYLYSLMGRAWPGHGWIGDVFITRLNDERYLAAKLSRPEGDVYAALYVGVHTVSNSLNNPWIQLDVIEIKPMETGMVKVDAEALGKDIRSKGYATLYGIYFDTDKAVIKPASRPTLEEIAKLLKRNPSLKVLFVGHTDARGSLQYNMDLSHRRAAAVRDTMQQEYGIEPERLGAAGVGFLAPVASNRTEEGRAKNRRVEMVELTEDVKLP